MMFLSILFLMFLDQPSVHLTTLEGDQQSGRLTAITDSQVTIQVDGIAAEIPAEKLIKLELTSASASSANTETEPDQSPQEIQLLDGSRIQCRGTARSAQMVTTTTQAAGELMIPVTAVKAIQLLPSDEKYADQWKSYVQRETKKDLLIVPKREGDGLDFLAGVVSTISAEEITFLLDGDTIPVPAAKVYGVVFAETNGSKLTSRSVVHAASGFEIGAASITFADGTFMVTTAWGQKLSLSSGQIQMIDFSVGRIRYLSDLNPLKEDFSGIDPDDSLFTGLVDSATLQLMYGPRRDTTLDSQIPIRLRGQRFAKGMCIHSRTELTYALDRKFTVLEAIVGIDDLVSGNQQSIVSLTISGDGKQLYQQNISTQDAPVPLKVSLENVATLTILVDYGDNDSSCDWLDLADAKLILATEDK
jgi:hypothetical protein